MTMRRQPGKLLTALLLGTTLLAATGAAAAVGKGMDDTYDPSQMPAFHGKVTQYDLTPRGDVDGLILDDGTEVHFPPHLGTEVVAAIRPGEMVTIHGLKARALPLIQAMSVTGDASGKTVVDNGAAGLGRHGPPPPHGGMGSHGPMGGANLQAQGTVKMALHGPRGDLNGVLLTDGTMVHLPPPEAERLSALLAPGQTIMVRGDGVENSLGRSIGAESIGPSADKMTQIAPPGRGHHHPGGPDAPPPPGDAPPPPR